MKEMSKWQKIAQDTKGVDVALVVSALDFVEYWKYFFTVTKNSEMDTSPKTVEAIVSRGIYKGTSCGAWFCWMPHDYNHESYEPITGIAVGSIVEGVDWGTEIHELRFPFRVQEFWEAIGNVEQEVKDIWNNTHGCEDCFPDLVTDAEQEDNEYGYRYVDPNCPNCEGYGIAI